MRATISSVVRVGGVALLGSVSVAFATHIVPTAAKKFTTSLVTSYTECDSGVATSTYLGLPACPDPQPSNPDCTFGAEGSGKAKATVVLGDTHDIKLVAKLTGLSDGCEGDTLTGVVRVRVTLDECDDNLPCTVNDVDLPIATCQVENNACRVTGTVNEALAGLLQTGSVTSVEILGCVVTGPNADDSAILPTFSCGLLVP